MHIQPAHFAQFKRGRGGKTFYIEEDVLDIVKQVKDIDSKLSVYWNEYGEYYTIVEMCEDGAERLVFSCNALDQRVLERLRRLISPDYNVVKEMDRLDSIEDKRISYKTAEEVGVIGEKLAHALRKDLQVKSKIILPRDL